MSTNISPIPSLNGHPSRLDSTSCSPSPSSMESREIFCIGLNPAFQTTLHFEHFRPKKVNRAYRKCHSIGGKGQNFAIACQQYGYVEKVSILQFAGGLTGSYIKSELNDKNVHHIDVDVHGATRTCTTVLCRKTNTMTELIEPAGRVDAESRNKLESLALQVMKSSPNMECIALCGTLPPGISGSTYTLIAENKPDHIWLFLDAYQDVTCLKTGKVDILKINSEEALILAGIEDEEEEDILKVGKIILNKYSLKILAITNGSKISYLFDNRPDAQHELDRDTAVSPSSLSSPISIPSNPRNSEPSISITAASPVRSHKEITPTPSSGNSIPVYSFQLPDLFDLIDEDDECFNAISCTPCFSSSLPSPTLSDNNVMNELAAKYGASLQVQQPRKRHEGVLLNPLGAGDTCSGVFVVEFLETQHVGEAFKCGLAAASASCLVMDYTSHFDRKIMEKIKDRILVEKCFVDLST